MDRNEAGGIAVLHSERAALRHVVETGAREVRIGLDVPNPLTVARALHAAHPDVTVTLVLGDEELGRLERALASTPLLFGRTRCVTVGGEERVLSSAPARATDGWAIMEGAPDAVILVDGNGAILGATPKAAAWFGEAERALLGASLLGFHVESEQARLGAHLRDGGSSTFATVAGGLSTVVAWRYPGPDPTLRVVWVREPEQVEARLRTDRQFLDAVVENIPTMVFVKDAADLRFVRFNRAGEELLGYARADLMGRNDFDFFPKEEAEAFTAKDREVLRVGRVVDIPEEPIHTAGGTRWLHTRKVPLLDAHGVAHHLLGISEDITDRRRIQHQNAALMDELKRSNAELELFASVASHDLQEPLRKVQQFGERLRTLLGTDLTPDALDNLTRLDAAVARMRQLVYGLLTYSRVTSCPRQVKAVDLDQVLEDVTADLEVRITRSRGVVHVSPLPRVSADGTQMRQLFQNLIGNALKFHAPDRPPVVEVTGRVLPPQIGADPMVEILVRDEGIGFDQGDAELAFRPFQRLNLRSDFEGTGMGLAICRRIVERQGGTITASSEPGVGSTFVVRLKA